MSFPPGRSRRRPHGLVRAVPTHGLLSALLTLRIDEHWSVDTFATNLTNEVYKSGQGLNNGNYYFYGPPREYGAHVTFRF